MKVETASGMFPSRFKPSLRHFTPLVPSGAMRCNSGSLREREREGSLSICFEWRPHSPRGSRGEGERERERGRRSQLLPSPSITTDREVMRSSADSPPQQQQLNFSPRSTDRRTRTDPTAKRPRPMSTPTCAHLTPRPAERLMTGRRFRCDVNPRSSVGEISIPAHTFTFWFSVTKGERNRFGEREGKGERRLIEA